MGTRHLDSETLRALVARYLEHGDEAAIEEVVGLTRPRLLAAARRIGRPGDAEDAVQVAYLSLVRRRGAPLEAPVFPWLLTATLRVAYRKKAAHQRQNDIARALAVERAPQALSDAGNGADLIALVQTKVASLPALYRDVLFLHCIAGLAQDDVARLLDIPIATVRTRLHRGRGLLEGALPPRLRAALCAVPWWIRDLGGLAAGTATGVVMTKQAAAITAAVLMLAIGGGTWMLLSAEGDPPDVPPIEESAKANVPTHSPTTAPAPHALPAPILESTPSPAPTAPTEKPAFSGRVLDPAGRPIAGARIETRAVRKARPDGGKDSVYSRMHDPDRDVVSDARGAFVIDPDASLQPAQASALDVLVIADGHPLTLAQVRRDVPKDIVLGPAGTLRITVRDPNGEGVAGVRLGLLVASEVLHLTGHFEVHPFLMLETDANGHVEQGLQDGSYRVHVAVAGHPSVLTNALDHAAAKPLDHTIDLVAGSTVRLRVLGESQTPIEGATVLLGSPRNAVATRRTDREGVVSQGGFPLTPRTAVGQTGAGYWDGRAYYYVTAPGYAPTEGTRALPAQAGTVQIEVQMQRGIAARVRVVDDVGAPIEDATVTVGLNRNISNPLRTTRGLVFKTDRTGVADMGRLYPHQNLLTVRANNRTHEWFHKKVVYPAEGELEIVLRRQGGRISGRALGPDGKVVEGLTVAWSPLEHGYTYAAWAGGAPAGKDGSFVVERVIGGEGHLVLRAPGYAPQRIRLDLERGGEAKDVQARLSAEGVIAGVVVSRDGTPIARAPVTLSQTLTTASGGQQQGEMCKTKTDAAGKFTFRGAPDGESFALWVGHPDWLLIDWLKFQAVKRGDDDLRVVMKPAKEGRGITLSLRITDAGKPYSGPIGLQWNKGAGKGPYMGTEIESKTPGVRKFTVWTGSGDYVFQLWAAGYRPHTMPKMRLLDVPNALVFDAPLDRGAEVTLRVQFDGKPLANTSLRVSGRWADGVDGSTSDTVMTDEQGVCTLGGFVPGVPASVHVVRQDDGYTTAEVESVAAPETVDVTLRRHGMLTAQAPITFSELTSDLIFLLYGPDGEVVEKKVVSPRDKRWAKYAVSGWFRITERGRYRVEVKLGTRTLKLVAEVAPGQNVRGKLE